MIRMFTALAVLCLALVQTPAGMAETRLVMFEEQGCVWCETWREQVGDVYPITAEGKRAPLLVLDIHDPLPGHLNFHGDAHYTPTFVLMQDGTEVDRIIGYPGEAFFWGLLERMLADLDKTGSKS